MRAFLNKEIEKIIINESLIKSIAWCNEFKDITIDINWSGQEDLKREIDFNNIETCLHFEFVTNADINIKFEADAMGALEIKSFSFELKDDIWLIEFTFDFYSIGYFRFMCNDFRFVIDQASTKINSRN